MSTPDRFREYAADCLQKATGSNTPEEKNLHLNMALAWVRLAHQSEAISTADDADARNLSPAVEERAGDSSER